MCKYLIHDEPCLSSSVLVPIVELRALLEVLGRSWLQLTELVGSVKFKD